LRERKIVWSRLEIVVMITLRREKMMQYILLGVYDVTKQSKSFRHIRSSVIDIRCDICSLYLDNMTTDHQNARHQADRVCSDCCRWTVGMNLQDMAYMAPFH